MAVLYTAIRACPHRRVVFYIVKILLIAKEKAPRVREAFDPKNYEQQDGSGADWAAAGALADLVELLLDEVRERRLVGHLAVGLKRGVADEAIFLIGRDGTDRHDREPDCGQACGELRELDRQM